MNHPDFVEGVTARLINKPAREPNWQPKVLEEVSDADVQKFFQLPEGEQQLSLLSEGPDTQYTQYPHQWLALPTEDDIRKFIRSNSSCTSDQVINHFLAQSGHKLGVKEKVEEVFTRVANQ